MSKILLMDYGWCNFHNIIELVKSGHDVKVTTSSYNDFDDIPHAFWDQYGVEIVDHGNRDSFIKKWLLNSDRDMVINTHPMLGHWSKVIEPYSDRFEYLGMTKMAGSLEKNKWLVRSSMQNRMPPILVPKVVRPIAPCVAKPKVLEPPNDVVSICHHQWQADRANTDPNSEGKLYFEEYIPKPSIETNVDFVVSNGKWSIRHTQEIVGEDVCKEYGKFQHWTCIAQFKPLPDWVEDIVLAEARVILDWIATQVCPDASFIGQITGLFTPNGDWYFCEINSRPEQTCSLPIFVTGDEFLEAFRGKPEILGDAFPNDVDKLMVVPEWDNAPYPMDLHEKYGVAIPCGLDLNKDGTYTISDHMKKPRQRGNNLIGMVVCDAVIPEGFVTEFEQSAFKIISKMLK